MAWNSCVRRTLLAVAITAMAPHAGAWAADATIAKIRADQTLRIGYREDAPPFSYRQPGAAEPTGYVVELCRVVAKHLADQLRLAALKISYVPVTAANRFDAVERRDVDLLCEPTSATLSRRERVDFSIPTFIDGASLLTRDTSLGNLKAMAGKNIGVLSGTTTEQRLRGFLKDNGIGADVVPAATHEEGLSMIDTGKVTAYFADQTILMFLLNQSKDPEKLAIANEYLSMEVYALALPRGDSEFRLAVDTALSRIYRGGEIGAVFDKTFGGKVRPTLMLRNLYQLTSLPD